jgi:hypothetical protein
MRVFFLYPQEKVVMTKKWIAITLLLLVVTGWLAWRLNIYIHQFKSENDLAKIQPVKDIKQKMVQEKTLPKLAPPKIYNTSEFTLIPDNNLFTDTRTKEDKVESAPPEPPPLAQKPILVGVSIADNSPRASIIDPTSPGSGQNRRAQVRRVGDVYHGYTITEIAADHIVLESGTRKEIIPLHEGSKRAQGGKTPIMSTRVVSFGGSGISGGTPVNIASGSPGSGRTVVSPVGSPATTNVNQTVVNSTAAATQQRNVPAATPTTTPQPQPTAPGVRTDAQGRRVVRTPFGDILQRQ